MKNEEDCTLGLIDFVFSWSITDVMNNDLYSNKVNQIPDTFSSVPYYLTSFVIPLIEETHADLRSNLVALHSAPARQILEVEKNLDFNPPKNLSYLLRLAKSESKRGMFEPEFGDLIALTEVRPKCIDDLNGPKLSYVLAFVQGMSIDQSTGIISILSSKPIFDDNEDENNRKMKVNLFAVYLTNLKTNMRIWNVLHPGEGGNAKIISSVLGINPLVEESVPFARQKVRA